MEVAEMKMLRFAVGVTRKDKIRNAYIRNTVKVERLRMKLREDRLKWYGHVMRRNQEYVGRRVTEMELPEKREAKEKISGCSDGGYRGGWCKGDGCWKQDAVEEHHALWQPLIKEKAERKQT